MRTAHVLGHGDGSRVEYRSGLALRARSWLVSGARRACGLLLCFAGFQTIASPATAVRAVAVGLPGIEHVGLVVGVSALCELWIGVALMLAPHARAARVMASIMLVAYITFVASLWIRGVDVRCGCPLTPGSGEMSYLFGIVRNALMLMVLTWPVRRTDRMEKSAS